jgi:hypothetical protein
MGSFQVYDALSIFFKLEKPLVGILRVVSFCQEKVANCKKIFRTFHRKFQLKNSKKFPHKSAKVGALMVGGMFAVVVMSC